MKENNYIIPLSFSHNSLYKQAKNLADTWNIKLEKNYSSQQYLYQLILMESGLFLIKDDNKTSPLQINFSSGKYQHRRLYGGGKSQLIAKAFGIHKGVKAKVLDLTAGLARDAFVLASLGCEVIMIERSNILCALIDYALREVQADQRVAEIITRMQIKLSDSLDYLKTLKQDIDMIYLDPMYPEKKGSAKVKKEMQFLQEIIGKNEQADELLIQAIDKAKYRVIVKRPKHAEYLAHLKPQLQLQSKNQRFDIYINRSITK